MGVQTPIPMSMETVFPFKAFMSGEIEAVSDFDAPQKPGGVRAQKLDKVTGLPLWAVPVIDGDEKVRGAAKSVKVNIAARVQPVPPPALPGLPFRPVEFEGLTVTPYVSDSNGSRPRVAYSLRASGLSAPGVKSSKAAPAA